jgi:hypothetical protein
MTSAGHSHHPKEITMAKPARLGAAVGERSTRSDLYADAMSPELHQLIERHCTLDAKRTRRLRIVMWSLAALTAVVLVAPAITGRHDSLFRAGVGIGFAALFGGFARLVSAGSRRNTDRLRRALEQSRTVVWLYLENRKMYGATLYRFVILRPADGSQIIVATPSQDAERTLATLRAHMPHALVGYGAEQRARYEAARRAT